LKKYFVVDTNVLLHNADSLTAFADNIVVLPISVIEELDKFKSHNDELGRNARYVIRQLDALRQKGRLGEGVVMDGGGTLQIYMEKGQCIDTGLDMHVADNRILAVAFTLLKQGKTVIFVSKDINARIKADALGIEVMDFEKQKVNIDELYRGQREILVPGLVIDEFYQKKQVATEALDLMPNEFVLLRDEEDEKHTALTRAREGQMLGPLHEEYETVWNIRSRSKEQRMAFELLMDPAIQLVTLVGQAGTGKTLLALAAALECVLSLKSPGPSSPWARTWATCPVTRMRSWPIGCSRSSTISPI
jgi:PhoH-like ATPase